MARLVPCIVSALAVLCMVTPLRARDRMQMPLALSALGGGTALYLMVSDEDEDLSRSISANRDHEWRDVAAFGKALGEVPLNLSLFSGIGAYGWYHGDFTAVMCARGGLTSAALTTGLFVPALKIAFGRFRPNADRGSQAFDPLDGPGRSFPSGHTAMAFSFAGTVNTFYPGWPGRLSVLLASATAYSRVRARSHWTSDVLAGGMIGFGTATVVARAIGRRAGKRFALTPELARNYTGATITSRF